MSFDPARRYLFGGAAAGLGGLALSMLKPGQARANAAFHRTPSGKLSRGFGKAKNVIFLHMAGAPSQLDLFSHKPTLNRHNGAECPAELLKGKRFAFLRGVPRMLGSPYKFKQHGRAGAWVSELMPHFPKIVDDVAILSAMHTDEFNHAPAQLFTLTGKSQFGGASLGSWMTYGLGTENQNLPGFVVLLSGGKFPDGGKSLWGSAYLPSVHQGVQVRSEGNAVLYLSDPPGLDRKGRRETLDALGKLNGITLRRSGDPETEARVGQYELAYRMQASVPGVIDLQREPQHILELYGAKPGFTSPAETADDPRTLYKGDDPTFANNCLMARRLVENGVRFVQLFDWGWDHHGISPGESIDETLPIKARQIDRAVTGLILDLKQRGLLDETLVVWCSEFGRTPMQQNADTQRYIGRDHHPHAFTAWMAGGGIKGGQVYGETDEIGFSPTKDAMHMRDMQAMILHLAGLDPWRYHYPFQGLDQRLIGPEDDKARLHAALLA